MTETFIPYDKLLPEIPARHPWEPPEHHLVKDDSVEGGWRVKDGRRPSKLMLPPSIRTHVDEWRNGGYPGVSETTRLLLTHWFEDEHLVDGQQFRFHFSQREAIETLIWLVEAIDNRDCRKLIETHASEQGGDLISKGYSFQTLADGRRQVILNGLEHGKRIEQDIPPEDLCRYAFKMATGSGKTLVMAMAIVWSYLNKSNDKESGLASNFLIVAPNVIVFQRLKKDFVDNSMFTHYPILPTEYRTMFSPAVITRGNAFIPGSEGNIILTNVQQLYLSRSDEESAENPVEGLVGKPPIIASELKNIIPILERLKNMKNLAVINDEAHHVHDDNLQWNKSLLYLHDQIAGGLSFWLDYSATPKDARGYFPWTVCDYPLAQAVEDKIVKSPLIVLAHSGGNTEEASDEEAKRNVIDAHEQLLKSACHRLEKHNEHYSKVGIKPVLFIMTENNADADEIGNYLTGTTLFAKSEILVIHTNKNGEIRKNDLSAARDIAQNIDSKDNKIKAIVSVLMLREGWDVKNVSVVLGLRPYTSKAAILPEQVIGRGLRLMDNIGPDKTQTLEVMGTPNLIDFLKDELEADGVGVVSVGEDNVHPPVTITPVKDRFDYDIELPITKPRFYRSRKKFETLDLSDAEAIFDAGKLTEDFKMKLRMEFQPTETEIHQETVDMKHSVEAILSSIAEMVMSYVKITGVFAKVCEIVKQYVENLCFGKRVSMEDGDVIACLSVFENRRAIAVYLALLIGKKTLGEIREVEFVHPRHKLSSTKPFTWRRDLPPLVATKTVFNYVATYNKFERTFAEFLDEAVDVPRFAALATTEQGGSGTLFRIDYLKQRGAIGYYYPDWVVIQETSGKEVGWIIETKGRVWNDTPIKDEAARIWCSQVNEATGEEWRYFRVNQTDFKSTHTSLQGLISACESRAVIDPQNYYIA